MKMIPSNVVRCASDNGPILYPSIGNPYRCETCGELLKGAEHVPGTHWDEAYGYLVQVETVDDPRDTEEEIEDLYGALRTLAAVFGDGLTAYDVGPSFTCSEANDIAQALMVGGNKKAAMTFLEGHAGGDSAIEEDAHHDVEDFEAYVLTLAGEPVPELVEEPERVSLVKEAKLPTVTTEELLKLMNLD
ncbi:hypothetical protein SEA_HANK144_74 [Streptomyces phage Hank144]|uniref:Uncharacterized protein n=1 Tax=Streptomyces phage Hank144 TaxID=2301573 RepID=A0A385DQK6_9CAUD|nr:hypothetical protein KGG76_gp74 [Streptomyces phage Hank144]AXQ61127.1 hypothetical protein SEA_HANK144_74 [Streptomyces phage Hank144]